MAELKLGKLPDRTPVKLIFMISPSLAESLNAYAALYAEVHGQSEPVAELVPAILASFLEADRGFQKSRQLSPKS